MQTKEHVDPTAYFVRFEQLCRTAAQCLPCMPSHPQQRFQVQAAYQLSFLASQQSSSLAKLMVSIFKPKLSMLSLCPGIGFSLGSSCQPPFQLLLLAPQILPFLLSSAAGAMRCLQAQHLGNGSLASNATQHVNNVDSMSTTVFTDQSCTAGGSLTASRTWYSHCQQCCCTMAGCESADLLCSAEAVD